MRIVYIPAATGIPALVAETSPQAYTGEALTLAVQVTLDTVLAEVVEDQGSQQALYGPANITSGSYGLEARTLGLTGPGTEGHAQFDDIQWQLLSGTSETRNYAYNNLNQLTAITGAENTTYSYNDAGLMTQQVKNGVASDHAYDRLNRLKSVNVGGANGSYSEYSYFGSSWMRRSASVDGTLTHYMYDGFACVGQTTAGTTTLYGVPGQTPLWEKTGAAATLVYPQDGRGNITGLWNGTQYVQKYNYDAFGNVKTTDATGHAIQNTSGPRFQGQLYDAATDQVYLRNRYYSPGTGKFNAVDPVGYEGGHNLYGYCMGDPVNNDDLMGDRWHPLLDRDRRPIPDVFRWEDDGEGKVPPQSQRFPPGYTDGIVTSAYVFFKDEATEKAYLEMIAPNKADWAAKKREQQVMRGVVALTNAFNAAEARRKEAEKNDHSKDFGRAIGSVGNEIAETKRDAITMAETAMDVSGAVELGMGVDALVHGGESIATKATERAVEGAAVDTGALGGRLLTKEEFTIYEKEVTELGGKVRTNGETLVNPRSKARYLSGDEAGKFVAEEGTIYLRKDATRYVALHEKLHAEQFFKLFKGDIVKFKTIGPLEQEKWVYKELYKRYWGTFSQAERSHAVDYLIGYFQNKMQNLSLNDAAKEADLFIDKIANMMKNGDL